MDSKTSVSFDRVFKHLRVCLLHKKLFVLRVELIQYVQTWESVLAEMEAQSGTFCPSVDDESGTSEKLVFILKQVHDGVETLN